MAFLACIKACFRRRHCHHRPFNRLLQPLSPVPTAYGVVFDTHCTGGRTEPRRDTGV